MMNEKLRDILLSIMKDDSVEVTPESMISADLGISSFDLLQVIYSIENEFLISIPMDKAKSFITVQDLINCITNTD